MGGGPRLGRCRLTLELCRLSVLVPAVLVAVVATVDTLVLLGERPSGSATWRVPLLRDAVWRGTLTLEPDAAVWVVRPGGSLTGRVGDLTFGFTNPVPDGEGCRAGGLLIDDDVDGFDEPAVALGVSTFSGCLTVLSGVFAGSLGADASAGLLGALLTVGDLAGLEVDLLVEGTARGLGAALATGFVVGLVASSTIAFSFPFPLPVPLTGPGAALGAELLSATAALAGASSTPGFFALRGVLVEASGFGSPFLRGDTTASATDSVLGDSGMGSLRTLVLAGVFVIASPKIFELSGLAGGVDMSVSPLSLRKVEMFESWLGSRC